MLHAIWELLFLFLFLFFYYTLSSGVHVQIMQDCYKGKHMPWWFAASIPQSLTLGISPNVIPPQLPTRHCPSPSFPPQQTPVCDAPLPVSMCSYCSTPTCE